jgi:hypothetical protein
MIGGEYTRKEVHCRGRSQWPRGLRLGSAAVRLLELRVRISSRAWMFVCCDCCVVSGRGFCVGLITRPEESYRMCECVCVYVSECDREALKMRRPCPTEGCCALKNIIEEESTNIWTDVLRVPVNGTCARSFSVVDSVVSRTVCSSAITGLPVQG